MNLFVLFELRDGKSKSESVGVPGVPDPLAEKPILGFPGFHAASRGKRTRSWAFCGPL